MNVLEKFGNNRYLILTLIFALLNMGAIFLIFGFQKYGDTSQYIEVIHWFQGEDAETVPWRVLRPLGPLIAVPFEFLGEGAGLIVQNAIFYLLCAFLMFKITDLIYQNKKQAFFASLFFITAVPAIGTGLAYLTDTGAWFFYLLSIFLTLVYLRTKNEKLIFLNGFFSGIGVLMKENGGLGVLFFGLMILFSRNFTIKEKISKIARFGILFLIPVLTLQILMFKYFHFTSLDWYSIGGADSKEGLFLTFLRYFGHLFIILGILWPFFLIGIWKEWQEKNRERIKMFLALLPSSFSFLLWTIDAGARSVFIFAPMGMILASNGLEFFMPKIKKTTLAVFFMSIAIFNYYFCWVNPKVQFFERIAGFLGIL